LTLRKELSRITSFLPTPLIALFAAGLKCVLQRKLEELLFTFRGFGLTEIPRPNSCHVCSGTRTQEACGAAEHDERQRLAGLCGAGSRRAVRLEY
jgi:hypothetical protein